MTTLNVEEKRVLYGIYTCSGKAEQTVPLLPEHILYFARDQFSAFTERSLDELPRDALRALAQGPGVVKTAEILLNRLESVGYVARDRQQPIMVGLTASGVRAAGALRSTGGILGHWVQDHATAVVTGSAGFLVTAGVVMAVAA